MSKLALYDFPPPKYSELNKLVKYLPLIIKNAYYQLRVCCYQSNLELPTELWNEIIYQICEPIENPILDYKVLDWYDKYIHDKTQHNINPILMDTTNISSGGVMGYLCSGVDMVYNLQTVKLSNYNTLTIPRNGDLVVGIVKDDRIKSISFEFGGSSPIKYQVSELYEYTLNKVYSHSLDEIIKTNISTATAFTPDLNLLLDLKYLNKQNMMFWSADTMPFSLISSPYHSILMQLETTEPVTEIKLLYGHTRTEIRNHLGNNMIQYKNLTYNTGMIFIGNEYTKWKSEMR